MRLVKLQSLLMSTSSLSRISITALNPFIRARYMNNNQLHFFSRTSSSKISTTCSTFLGITASDEKAERSTRKMATESDQEIVLGEDWPEHKFSEVAECTLEVISDTISNLADKAEDVPNDFDVNLSQGVLTISLGNSGTYVLNTQTPNRQIWLSSPCSGPWRYAWNPSLNQWVSTRDSHLLIDRLSKEFRTFFNQSISFTFAIVSS